MFRNIMLANLRGIIKDRAFTLVNLLGLIIGFTSFILILSYYRSEVSYDLFHQKHERIYRMKYEINDLQLARVPVIMREHVTEYFPEIEKAANLFVRQASIRIETSGDVKRFEEDGVFFADPEWSDILDLVLIEGSIDDALRSPYNAILSRETAERYFGQAPAIGKTVYIEGRPFRVATIVEDFPEESHIHFDLILPFENMYDLENDGFRERLRQNLSRNWMISHSQLYVLLKPGSSPNTIDQRLPDFVKEVIPQRFHRDQSFALQPLADIHLNNEVLSQPEPANDRQSVTILLLVGILILFISLVNFINLSTARLSKKVKEVGVRKVLGVSRTWLVFQLLVESYILVFVSLFASVLLAIAALPALNEVMGRELNNGAVINPEMGLIYLALGLVCGVAAGLYPSISAVRNISEKGLKTESKKPRPFSFRSSLITIQFTIAIGLICLSLVVFYQLQMMKNRPLGFDQATMITIPVQSANTNNVFGGLGTQDSIAIEAFQNKLTGLAGVRASAMSSILPGLGITNHVVQPQGYESNETLLAPMMSIDDDFLDVYQVPLLAGEKLPNRSETEAFSLLINEKAVTTWKFGSPEEALGKSVTVSGRRGRVVGVIKDFHVQGLTQPIRPLLLRNNSATLRVLSIKLVSNNFDQLLSDIERMWVESFPNQTFNYSFLDEQLFLQYQNDQQLAQLVSFFAVIALFLSCFGTYGLLIFLISKKMKELAIRKVLGSTTPGTLWLLSRPFIYTMILAAMISYPLAIWLALRWLESFSFRIPLNWQVFILPIGLIVLLMGSTVLIHALRVQRLNPVDSLRVNN